MTFQREMGRWGRWQRMPVYDFFIELEMEKLEPFISYIFLYFFCSKLMQISSPSTPKMDPSKKEQLTPQGNISIFFARLCQVVARNLEHAAEALKSLGPQPSQQLPSGKNGTFWVISPSKVVGKMSFLFPADGIWTRVRLL